MEICLPSVLLKSSLFFCNESNYGNRVEHSSQKIWAQCSTRWPSAQHFRSIIQPNYHISGYAVRTHLNEGFHAWIFSMFHYSFCYHSSFRFFFGSITCSNHSYLLSLIGSQVGLLCLLAMYFFAEEPTNGGKRDSFYSS